MRILLDEQLPRQLAPHFVGHDVRAAQQHGWAGLKNGALLKQALSAGLEVLVTGDKNLEFQQNLKASGQRSRCDAWNEPGMLDCLLVTTVSP